MPAPVYITGPAGTGKTSKLLDITAECARELLTQPHQKVLAMAYMHGARRRLELSIEGHAECRTIAFTICTIDSFALSLVNRWRSALGIGVPVVAAPATCTRRFERHARLHLPFDDLAAYAADLLRKPIVARIVGSSHPLVVIDEFQDCTGRKLEIVKALSEASQLILAADPFQLLQSGATACPAVAWVEELCSSGLREHHQLTEPHRFSANSGIFLAARALREKTPLESPTVAVHYGPALPASWWIMERLLLGWYGPRWSGTTALISPSSTGAIDDVLRFMSEQSVKQGHNPIRWARQSTSDEEEIILQAALGVTSDNFDEDDWRCPAGPLSASAAEVIDRAYRFAQLRGLDRIPKHLIASISGQMVHMSRAHSKSSARFVVTTVHGAKNREFDNVCIIWSYRIPPDPELQRRLLYNAVTRAKTNCVVFDTRRKDIVTNDSIIGLLGSPKPIFSKKKARKTPLKVKTKRVTKPKK
jgi:AAA domain/UvrD-like helicase C-terminal domain